VAGLKLSGVKDNKILDNNRTGVPEKSALWDEVKNDLNKSGASLSVVSSSDSHSKGHWLLSRKSYFSMNPAQPGSHIKSKIEDLMIELKQNIPLS